MLHEGYSLQANVKVAGLLVEFPAESGPALLTVDGLLTAAGLAVEPAAGPAAEPAAVLAAGFESVQPWNAPNQATVLRATVQEVAKEVNRNRESNRIFMAKLRGVVSVGGNKGVGVRPRADGSDQASGIFVSRAGASLAF
jgi:hypothetical protein